MIRTLRRDPLPAGVERLFSRCFASVPDGGLVLHLAVMLGRPAEAVRLSIMIPRRDVHDYLSGLGWRTGLDKLACTIDDFGPYADFEPSRAHVQIDLDIGEVIGPVVGLMLHPPRPAAWAALLDALVQARLCAPQKRDALLAWPGCTVTDLKHDGRVSRYVLERNLSHAKITCAASAESRVKAYFGVTTCVS